jgi:hypothetical protein
MTHPGAVRLELGPSGWRGTQVYLGWFLAPVAAVATRQWAVWGDVALAAYLSAWGMALAGRAAGLRTGPWLAGAAWTGRLPAPEPRRWLPDWTRWNTGPVRPAGWVAATAWATLWIWLLWTRLGPGYGAGWAVLSIATGAAAARAALLAARSGMWLSGTTLVARGVARSVRCDLAAATTVRVVRGRAGLPVLRCAESADGGRLDVRLWRVHGGAAESLPYAQRRALAEAVARGPASRSPDGQHAREVLLSPAGGGAIPPPRSPRR